MPSTKRKYHNLKKLSLNKTKLIYSFRVCSKLKQLELLEMKLGLLLANQRNKNTSPFQFCDTTNNNKTKVQKNKRCFI